MTQIFLCGPPKNHECDSDGPEICGGENEDGTSWQGPVTEENKKRANWGSVTCSVCGMSAMELSLWKGES